MHDFEAFVETRVRSLCERVTALSALIFLLLLRTEQCMNFTTNNMGL